MAKATVQAALGPVALKRLAEDPNSTDEDKRLAEIVLTICVLSIVVTAPIGAILISISGTKLLTKTKQLHVVEGAQFTFETAYKVFCVANVNNVFVIFRLASQSPSVAVRHQHHRRGGGRSRRSRKR